MKLDSIGAFREHSAVRKAKELFCSEQTFQENLSTANSSRGKEGGKRGESAHLMAEHMQVARQRLGRGD